MAAQWLRLFTFTVGGTDLTSDQGTKMTCCVAKKKKKNVDHLDILVSKWKKYAHFLLHSFQYIRAELKTISTFSIRSVFIFL